MLRREQMMREAPTAGHEPAPARRRHSGQRAAGATLPCDPCATHPSPEELSKFSYKGCSKENGGRERVTTGR